MDHRTRRKLITFAAAGTIFEYYDLGLIGFLSVLIGRVYFPVEGPVLSAIAAMGTFAVAYLARPIGALIFGHIGDRYGRKKALIASLSIMTIPTTTIGLLPSYESLGAIAPIVLVFCRFLQGLGVGGEYNGSAIFYLEHETKSSHRGFYSSLLSTAGLTGFLLASVVAYIVTLPGLPDELWRVAFFIGAFIALIGWYIRRHFSETPEFVLLKKNEGVDKFPAKEVISRNKLKSLAMFGLGGSVASLSLSLIGMVGFLTKVLGIEHTLALQTNVIGILAYTFFTPFIGRMADLYGPLYIMKKVAILTIFIVPIIFLLISEGTFVTLLLGQVMLGLLAGGMLGPSHLLCFSIFGPRNRYTGVAFNFSLGLAIFGGCAPLMMSLLSFKTSPVVGPVIYMTAVMLATIANFYLVERLLSKRGDPSPKPRELGAIPAV